MKTFLHLRKFPWFSVAVGFLCVALGASLLTFGIVSVSNTRHNCTEIEALKSRVRARAIQDYKNLPVTAKLLHLKLSDLQKPALDNRNRLLKDYAPAQCKGFFG